MVWSFIFKCYLGLHEILLKWSIINKYLETTRISNLSMADDLTNLYFSVQLCPGFLCIVVAKFMHLTQYQVRSISVCLLLYTFYSVASGQWSSEPISTHLHQGSHSYICSEWCILASRSSSANEPFFCTHPLTLHIYTGHKVEQVILSTRFQVFKYAWPGIAPRLPVFVECA